MQAFMGVEDDPMSWPVVPCCRSDLLSFGLCRCSWRFLLLLYRGWHTFSCNAFSAYAVELKTKARFGWFTMVSKWWRTFGSFVWRVASMVVEKVDRSSAAREMSAREMHSIARYMQVEALRNDPMSSARMPDKQSPHQRIEPWWGTLLRLANQAVCTADRCW